MLFKLIFTLLDCVKKLNGKSEAILIFIVNTVFLIFMLKKFQTAAVFNFKMFITIIELFSCKFKKNQK